MNAAERTKVVEAIAHHDSMRGCYCWSGDNGNAQTRSRRENQLRKVVTVEVDGHVYRYQASVQISRTKVYYRGRFSKDGVKSGAGVRLFKSLLR